MSSELDDKIKLLLSDPNSALLKTLAKLIKAEKPKGEGRPLAERGSERRSETIRRSSERLHPPYVNSTKVLCSLCGSEETTNICMKYDPTEKCYRVFYSYLREGDAEYHVHKVTLIADACEKCQKNLSSEEKDVLISLLMSKIIRDERYGITLGKAGLTPPPREKKWDFQLNEKETEE